MLKVKNEVFTPLNEFGKREHFLMKDIKILDGTLDFRGLGYKATIERDGKKFKVYGRACGSPHCQCDAIIKAV